MYLKVKGETVDDPYGNVELISKNKEKKDTKLDDMES
jgi:hypothetical protein